MFVKWVQFNEETARRFIIGFVCLVEENLSQPLELECPIFSEVLYDSDGWLYLKLHHNIPPRNYIYRFVRQELRRVSGEKPAFNSQKRTFRFQLAFRIIESPVPMSFQSQHSVLDYPVVRFLPVAECRKTNIQQ